MCLFAMCQTSKSRGSAAVLGHLAPAPALLNQADGPRLAPAFVEWLMGLPQGWVTDPQHSELTNSQQITVLGNGVLPLQAATAIDSLRLLPR